MFPLTPFSTIRSRFGILPRSINGEMTFQSAASQPINKTLLFDICFDRILRAGSIGGGPIKKGSSPGRRTSSLYFVSRESNSVNSSLQMLIQQLFFVAPPTAPSASVIARTGFWNAPSESTRGPLKVCPNRLPLNAWSDRCGGSEGRGCVPSIAHPQLKCPGIVECTTLRRP